MSEQQRTRPIVYGIITVVLLSTIVMERTSEIFMLGRHIHTELNTILLILSNDNNDDSLKYFEEIH
jgi:hypothetical protein